jgi:hypothetical protein
MRTVVFALLGVILCVIQHAQAQAPICPNSAAMERCLLRFDRNGDKELDLDELTAALDSVSWYTRWTLSSPEKYMRRCDVDKRGTLSTGELLSSDCFPTCVEQRQMYMAVC